MDTSPSIEQRVAARERPEGMHVMHQAWHKLLFSHWPIEPEAIRRLIPEKLDIDTFDGKAWLTVTPLTITDLRPAYLPAVPYFSWLYELNVRSYVYLDGVPGVWFFSLDANSRSAVWGARLLFSLPYFYARITCDSEDSEVRFRSTRNEKSATFQAAWTIGEDLPEAGPGSLEFFLAERYCLYAADGEKVYRCRINHRPWPLQKAENVRDVSYGVIGADGIPLPRSEPMVHCGGPVEVDVWAPERVG